MHRHICIIEIYVYIDRDIDTHTHTHRCIHISTHMYMPKHMQVKIEALKLEKDGVRDDIHSSRYAYMCIHLHIHTFIL